MLKYFNFYREFGESYCRAKNETVKRINDYAETNNLKIVQVYSLDSDGLFVVFEKLN